MAALKVEVYQKEKVSPSSATPETLRSHKLCLLDMLVGKFYHPFVFFYDSAGAAHDYDALKESLSKTLSVLYPLAGRYNKDGSTIECNDEGADFVRANVTNTDLGEFLRRHPKLENLRQLLPLDPYPNAIDPAQPLLAVQVNRFRCGGTAVGFCTWHGVADAGGMTGMLNTLAAINRGEAHGAAGGLVVDATAIFPPGNYASFLQQSMSNNNNAVVAPKTKYYTSKRFVFSKQDIERLRNQCDMERHHRRRPSRVEALSAFLWAAVIRATLPANPRLKAHLLTHVVNLRNKLNPPLPSHCLGNINQVTRAGWEVVAGQRVTAESLVGRVVEAIDKVTDEYVREMHAEGGYLRAILSHSKKYDNKDETKMLGITSVCKFPFGQVDFGWGKPIRIGMGHKLEDLALFWDTEDGGIEVWIGLEHEVMWNLDKDMEFHAYVSFAQIISESSRPQPSAL